MEIEKTFYEIAARTAANVQKDDDDYIEDGLLHCGKCHGKKQTRVDVFGTEKIFYCLCKCAVEKREQEEQERKNRERLFEVMRMRKTGFTDAEMKDWTFDKDDGKNAEITQIARNYVDNFAEMKKRGKGLLLFGSVGTGKTFISACIANALIDKGRPCLVTNFTRLVNTISGMREGKQDYIDSLNDFDLLVIDDLESERDTEYMGEIVQNVIDSRSRAGLPLIITTNLTSEELKKPADIKKQRLYSRLLGMCRPVHVEGKDRRKQKLIDEVDEIDALLGLNVAKRNDN